MPENDRKAANPWLDFFLGAFGLIGLVVMLIRQGDNHLSWKHFIGGFVVAWAAAILLVAVCVAALVATTEESTSRAPVSQPQRDLTEIFGCQWIMDSYRPMATLGHDTAVTHVSNEMALTGRAGLFVATGDAAQAVRDCATEEGTSRAPVSQPQRDLTEIFGCQWIMDSYRPMATLGHDTAVTHVSNEMALTGRAGLFVATGDAAQAVRDCVAQDITSTPTPTSVRSLTPTPRPVRSSTPTPETTSSSVTEGCLAAALLLTMFDGSIDMDLNAAPVYMEAMVTTDEISLNLIGETVVDLMLSFPDDPTPENLLEIIDAFGVYAETCDDLVPR